MKYSTTSCLVTALALAASGRAAAASPPCPAANTVNLSGSSGFIPVVQAVADILGSSVSIIYQEAGPCESLAYVLGDSGNPVAPDQDVAVSIAPGGLPGGVECTLPTIAVGSSTAAAAKIDIAASDLYISTCQQSVDPNLQGVGSGTGTKEYLGPVQAMTFAVPSASSAQVLSAEAAYVVFGFAASGYTVDPWNTPGDIFVPFWDSGTLEMTATAIVLPGAKWVNATNASSPQTVASTGAMRMALAGAAAKSSADANAAIGILGASAYVAGLRPLAFQAAGQACGYLPDSSSAAYDRINVRQGRYAIWGPEHLVAHVDSSGNPVGQNSNTVVVQSVLNALTATSQAPPASSSAGGVLTEAQEGMLIAAIGAPEVGLIPQCAMQVSRTTELGPEASYAPPAACSCAFEMAAGTVAVGHACVPCTADSGCGGTAPKCHFGYCESE